MSLFLFLFLVSFPIVSNALRLSNERAQPTDYCGVRAYDNKLFDRVGGGHDALPGEMPFYVSLEVINEAHFICGGVLIENEWVLTAAECASAFFGDLQVVFKERWLNKKIAVKGIYVHPRFNMTTRENNIALLLLREPVKFNEYIQSICLPEGPENEGEGGDEFFYGLNGTVAGWVKMHPFESRPTKMKITNVPIIEHDICRETFSKAGYNNLSITESVLCSGFQKGEEDQCPGDPGSPLMVNRDGRWIVAGLKSHGNRAWRKPRTCAVHNLLGIYTRVGHFLPWITDIIIYAL